MNDLGKRTHCLWHHQQSDKGELKKTSRNVGDRLKIVALSCIDGIVAIWRDYDALWRENKTIKNIFDNIQGGFLAVQPTAQLVTLSLTH